MSDITVPRPLEMAKGGNRCTAARSQSQNIWDFGLPVKCSTTELQLSPATTLNPTLNIADKIVDSEN